MRLVNNTLVDTRVLGLRRSSGGHFPTDGCGLLTTEIVLVGRGVAAFFIKQIVTSITFIPATHDIALIA
jgi:hypothetical protein